MKENTLTVVLCLAVLVGLFFIGVGERFTGVFIIVDALVAALAFSQAFKLRTGVVGSSAPVVPSRKPTLSR